MSKSLGNVLLVHDMIETIPGEAIRLALIGAHYRQPLDWSDDTIDAATRMLDRLYGAVRGIECSAEERANAVPPDAVVAALEDDLNTPKALSEIFDVVRRLNKASDAAKRHQLALQVIAAGDLLGLLQVSPEAWFAGAEGAGMPIDRVDRLIRERNAARANRDFAQADAIRDQLTAAGIAIEDGPDGTRWRRSG
jgi:cysteinyl-tRNA synthetase